MSSEGSGAKVIELPPRQSCPVCAISLRPATSAEIEADLRGGDALFRQLAEWTAQRRRNWLPPEHFSDWEKCEAMPVVAVSLRPLRGIDSCGAASGAVPTSDVDRQGTAGFLARPGERQTRGWPTLHKLNGTGLLPERRQLRLAGRRNDHS
jgi:hypothetical protein